MSYSSKNPQTELAYTLSYTIRGEGDGLSYGSGLYHIFVTDDPNYCYNEQAEQFVQRLSPSLFSSIALKFMETRTHLGEFNDFYVHPEVKAIESRLTRTDSRAFLS